MAAEVAVLVFEGAWQVLDFTGTITGLPSQSQPPTFTARCRSLTARTIDRLYLKVSVQHDPRL